MQTKRLSDKEHKYFVASLKTFIKEESERFGLSEEDVVWKLERELRFLKDDRNRK
jgi:hypothetical protein